MADARKQGMQRRLAAILSADAVGYSRLMGEDDVATVTTLAQCRTVFAEAAAAAGGRIVDSPGDNILAEFTSAVEAVNAAAAIQGKLGEINTALAESRRMRFRIGVNLGDVLTEDGRLYGDGVNIAARLEHEAEPGGVMVSASIHDQVLGKVAFAFTDRGEFALKNIPRPIRAYALALAKPEGPTSVAAIPATVRVGPIERPRLSIIVLPFVNLGGGAEQDYFVDGVTESLTTDLSRIAGSFVIARNTAFTFKGKSADVKQIGREVNVRYALEGSVQRGGNRLRVNVQLIDAESGHHLWAERFDRLAGDLFDMQDEIAAHLAGQLGTHLIAAEARHAAGAQSPDSTDHYFQGRAWLNKGIADPFLTEALACFDRALSLDPRNVEAMAGVAEANLGFATKLEDDRPARLAAAEAALTKALGLAPDHARALMQMGRLKGMTFRAADGIAQCERALVLDRNLAAAHAFIGLLKIGLGRGTDTEAHVQEALRLSPRDVHAYDWFLFAGIGALMAGRDEDAVAWSRRAIDANPNFALAHFYLAAAQGLLGRSAAARTAAQSGLALNPGFTIARFHKSAASDNPVYAAHRARVAEGLRRAGLPEG